MNVISFARLFVISVDPQTSGSVFRVLDYITPLCGAVGGLQSLVASSLSVNIRECNISHSDRPIKPVISLDL